MNAVICTLFEKNYHYGVGGLINSLYQNGFRGSVFIGYRGELPPWASAGTNNSNLEWAGATTFEAAAGLKLHFLPVTTKFHLANYKPFFMQQLFEGVAKDAESITYFDPDIVVKCQWSFIETWMKHGVAMVYEVAGNPMPATHPVRLEWVNVIKKANRNVTRELGHYFNSGFCAVTKENQEFLITWGNIIGVAIDHYDYKAEQFVSFLDRAYLFQSNDQDAFNIAAMSSTSPISEVGADGMDFIPGGWIMSHATGSPKPWTKNFVRSALKGIRPTRPDRCFWDYASTPISIFSNQAIKKKKRLMSLAGLIGRFYAKG